MTRSERELLEAWREGDQRAGLTLCERHYLSLAKFFANKVDAEAAGDLVQSTFLGCLESLSSFHCDSSFRTFLFAIAHHKLIDHIRRRELSGKYFDPSQDTIDQLDELGLPPVEWLAARRKSQLLLAALRKLSFEEQTVLELHYFEGLRIRELAEVFGLAPGTVKSRMRKSRAQLSVLLTQMARTPERLDTTTRGLEQWMREVREGLDSTIERALVRLADARASPKPSAVAPQAAAPAASSSS